MITGIRRKMRLGHASGRSQSGAGKGETCRRFEKDATIHSDNPHLIVSIINVFCRRTMPPVQHYCHSWSTFVAQRIKQTELCFVRTRTKLNFLPRVCRLRTGDACAIAEADFRNEDALAEKLVAYKATIARYESEPDTGEGKKELLVRARTLEAARDRALKQDPYFDYAEALLQIAIMLISVSMIAEIIWLAFMGFGLGIVGAFSSLSHTQRLFSNRPNQRR